MGEHCCAASLWISAMSGRPFEVPDLSGQASIPRTSVRKSAVVPTVATESLHACATAAFESSPLRCESTVFTTTLRHASPPLAFMYSAHAFMPSHEPLNTPGRAALSTSATVVTVIVLSVTPTSGLESVAFLHAAFSVDCTVVLSPRPPSPPLPVLLPPPLHAAASSATSATQTIRDFI